MRSLHSENGEGNRTPAGVDAQVIRGLQSLCLMLMLIQAGGEPLFAAGWPAPFIQEQIPKM